MSLHNLSGFVTKIVLQSSEFSLSLWMLVFTLLGTRAELKTGNTRGKRGFTNRKKLVIFSKAKQQQDEF